MFGSAVSTVALAHGCSWHTSRDRAVAYQVHVNTECTA